MVIGSSEILASTTFYDVTSQKAIILILFVIIISDLMQIRCSVFPLNINFPTIPLFRRTELPTVESETSLRSRCTLSSQTYGTQSVETGHSSWREAAARGERPQSAEIGHSPWG
jgi:hypothetical protein